MIKQNSENKETVLVTGGTGFVAGWCIVELLKQGYAVRTTVRSLSREKSVRAAVSAKVDPGDRLAFYTADLTADDGWDMAAAGCDYVLHVASPLGADNPKDPNALIVPAREGTLRVLRAAAGAGVKRVVMTSACAAASPASYKEEGITDETLWSDPENPKLTAYQKSKILSELAAWQFMKNYKGSTALTTVLPGAVFGPVLSSENVGSVQVIGRLMQGRIPGTPRLGFEVVDVRDLVDAHIRAMTSEQAAGQRFIAVGDFMWMSEIAGVLRTELGNSADKVPVRILPDFLMRFLSVLDPSLRSITPSLGRKHRHTPDKARRVLGWRTRPGTETVVDCARSLVEYKVI